MLEKSRFMKIFFDNIPNLNTHTPLWDENEKAIFGKLVNTTHHFDFEKELFSNSTPVFNYFRQYKIDLILNNTSRFREMLTWDQIKFAANLVYSRAIPISYKSWKEFMNFKL